jgi:hypothetical protein
MSFFVSIAVDTNALLPAGSVIKLTAVGFFNQKPFAVTIPGSFDNWVYPDPALPSLPSLPSDFPLTVEVVVGGKPPIKLQAGIPSDHSRLAVLVLPGTQKDPRFFFAGDVIHPKSQGAVCQVTCTNDGKTAGPGGCVVCENEDAIVKLCC